MNPRRSAAVTVTRQSRQTVKKKNANEAFGRGSPIVFSLSLLLSALFFAEMPTRNSRCGVYDSRCISASKLPALIERERFNALVLHPLPLAPKVPQYPRRRGR